MPQLESRRIQVVQSPIIPVVGELIQNTPGTISLGQGVVYYPPPSQAIDRIQQFWQNPDHHRYQAVQGIPELVAAIGAKLNAENGIVVENDGETPSEIVVTSGSNMGFVNAVLAITDPGDEVILQTPYYFNHEMAIRMANAVPVLVPTDDQYQLQLAAIRAAITPRTRAIVTISPNNPTGAVYPAADLRAVNQLCRDYGIYHIHDEAYEYFTYDGVMPFSPGSIPGSGGYTISLFSLSKAYGFASWRIGYMVLPAHLMAAVMKIQDTIAICPAVISQYAALGALEAGIQYCQHHLQMLAQVRQLCLEEFATLQDLCTIPPATGAFYFLLKVHTSMHPFQLVKQLIQDYQVAVIPGMTFGLEEGCYLRVAYGALQQDTVAEGIGRLVQGLRAIVGSGEVQW
ncbi:pyridoxal phosphate-dependent aminotransferase [Egbenema bharatensis]|uniref:pyridoxal phosphate-dependent aminotransferase n=1 Tax=Egbenema bharatensis TaxID=3463334 RepID=UPI003A88436A